MFSSLVGQTNWFSPLASLCPVDKIKELMKESKQSKIERKQSILALRRHLGLVDQVHQEGIGIREILSLNSVNVEECSSLLHPTFSKSSHSSRSRKHTDLPLLANFPNHSIAVTSRVACKMKNRNC